MVSYGLRHPDTFSHLAFKRQYDVNIPTYSARKLAKGTMPSFYAVNKWSVFAHSYPTCSSPVFWFKYWLPLYLTSSIFLPTPMVVGLCSSYFFSQQLLYQLVWYFGLSSSRLSNMDRRLFSFVDIFASDTQQLFSHFWVTQTFTPDANKRTKIHYTLSPANLTKHTLRGPIPLPLSTLGSSPTKQNPP